MWMDGSLRCFPDPTHQIPFTHFTSVEGLHARAHAIRGVDPQRHLPSACRRIRAQSPTVAAEKGTILPDLYSLAVKQDSTCTEHKESTNCDADGSSIFCKLRWRIPQEKRKNGTCSHVSKPVHNCMMLYDISAG